MEYLCPMNNWAFFVFIIFVTYPNIMGLNFKSITKPSFLQISLFLILGIVLWGTTYLGSYYTLENGISAINNTIPDNEIFIANVLCFVVTLLNAIVISYFLRAFGFVTSGSFVGAFIFFLLIVTWNNTHIDFFSHISLLLFIFSLFQFLSMTQTEKPTEKVFLGALFVGIGSLLIKELVFILPILWIGFMIIRCFSLRTFLASLFGAATPLLLFFTVNYFFYSPIHIFTYYNLYDINLSFENFPLVDWIYIGLLTLILVFLLITTYSDYNKKSIHIRRYINFILLLLIAFSFLCFSFLESRISFLPYIAFLYSIFFAHAYTNRKSNFYSITFIIFCCANVFMIIYDFLLTI